MTEFTRDALVAKHMIRIASRKWAPSQDSRTRGRDLSFRKGMIQDQSVQTVKRFVNTVLSPTSRADAKLSRPNRSRSELSFTNPIQLRRR